MKIKTLRISNVLSFKYYENISDVPEIRFDENLNIVIGENGSGKSTALEVLNFLFKRILFKQYNINQDFYARRLTILVNDKKQIVSQQTNDNYTNFRLEPNWDSENKPQTIVLEIELDEIDTTNLQYLRVNADKLQNVASSYSNLSLQDFQPSGKVYTINVTLSNAERRFQTQITPDGNDPGFLYLVNYNLFKELINLHNIENEKDQIPPLYESFTLIGGYRNFHAFNPAVSLSGSRASQQIQSIKSGEYSKSLNQSEANEPPVFNLVRLRVAEKVFDLIDTKLDKTECEERANQLSFLQSINKKLKLLELECRIRLIEKQTWEFAFEIIDNKRGKVLRDINTLSAGQKAIIHLVFEAYGRGDLKGGVVIIDEPEIHLHYQYQNEYLSVIEQINQEQKCQYILVTHSESLINSKTIDKVKRFALDENNNTTVKSPVLDVDEKTLIKILDNTRSTYAFFAKTIVLVEGDTDRYFFKAAFQELYPALNQEVAILHIGGKESYPKWKSFFERFGLTIYFIGDLDNVFSLVFADRATIVPASERNVILNDLKSKKLSNISANQKERLKTSYDALVKDNNFLTVPNIGLWKPLVDKVSELASVPRTDVIAELQRKHTNLDGKIEAKYTENVFILKAGSIEAYTGVQHSDLAGIINFCTNNLSTWLNGASVEAAEIKSIIGKIAT